MKSITCDSLDNLNSAISELTTILKADHTSIVKIFFHSIEECRTNEYSNLKRQYIPRLVYNLNLVMEYCEKSLNQVSKEYQQSKKFFSANEMDVIFL